MRIAYGAGHGGFGVTPGKRSPAGEYEWDFNNEVAIAFAKEMKNYNVKLMRTDDPTGKTDVLLKTRTDKANNWGADLYISFHHNAFQSKWGNHGGTETFYHAGSADGKRLAQLVQNAQLKAYGLRDRGIKTDNLHITRETRMVAVLCEGGFMDSNIDIKKLRDRKVLQRAGKEIAKAVANHFKLKRTSSKPSSNTNTSKPKPSTNNSFKWVGTKDKGKRVESIYKGKDGLNFYDGPRWTRPTGTFGYGEGWKVDNLYRVNGSLMYRVQNSKGKLFWITASKKYVKVTNQKYKTSKSKKKTIRSGSTVTLKKTAKKFTTGENIASHAKGKKYTVHQVNGNRVLLKSGNSFIGWVRKTDVK